MNAVLGFVVVGLGALLFVAVYEICNLRLERDRLWREVTRLKRLLS